MGLTVDRHCEICLGKTNNPRKGDRLTGFFYFSLNIKAIVDWQNKKRNELKKYVHTVLLYTIIIETILQMCVAYADKQN